MLFRLILTLAVCAGTIAVTPAGFAQTSSATSAVAAAPGDEVILDMHQAARKGDRKRLAALLPQARGHLLEPWAAYWELRARLDEATPQDVADFTARYAGTYQEDRLRNDWLLVLGSRRDWTTFSAEYPLFRMNDDREVRCYALFVEHVRTGRDVTEEVKRQWYGQREADEGCAFTVGRLHDEKKFSVRDVWIKARLAAEINRPRAMRVAVDIVDPDGARALADIQANPARYLSRKVQATSRTARELVVLALIRMAANDPDAAAGALDGHWSVHLSPEERTWAWGAIGKQAAQRLSTEALTYFGNAVEKDLNDDFLGWKVRAALRAGRWDQVLSATAAMSEDGRRDPTWVYWRARALLTQARIPAEGRDASRDPARTEAMRLFESIASVRGFYEQLALEETGQVIAMPPRPDPLSASELDAMRRHPGLQRAVHAIQIGLRPEGVREWNYSTNLAKPGGMDDRELLAAAAYACEREVWDRCINTSERTRAVFDHEQRFPMPHRDAVTRRAAQIGLDPAYVYGLIRQESRFITDARSSVGASGLMQVMPATARWTARKIGLTGFTYDQITDRDTNIAIGTGYLKLVLDDFEGSMPLAAAAYNAGPSRSRNWRRGPQLDAAIWAENIPFAETRDYVKKVLSNTTNYAAIITGKAQSLKARLGQVGPREAAAGAENKDLP